MPSHPVATRSDQPDPTPTLGLMTKFWDVGKVKTRLGASIGMRRAACLHRTFFAHLCRSLAGVGYQNVVSVAPDHRQREVRATLESIGVARFWMVVPQGGGDLGERIERWFRRYLVEPGSRAILIGADCPTLEPELIREAGQLLDRHDIVLGPALDGGYYLIGLRGSWRSDESRLRPLFQNVPWSTGEVLAVTRQRAQAAELTLVELASREDIDTDRELRRLRQSLDDSELKAAIDEVVSDPALADAP